MKINSNGSFNGLEDCAWNFSLSESQCVSSSRTVIPTWSRSSKLMFCSFVNIFGLKQTFSYPQIFVSKFHLVCISRLPKIWWYSTVQTWSTLNDLPPFWITSKDLFLGDWNNICYKPIPRKAELTLMEKKKTQRKMCLFCCFLRFLS